jgi:hypothetical protein
VVREQRPKDPAEFDQLRPILIGTRQATQLDAQDDSDMVKSDLGKEPVEPMTTLGGGGGPTLVFINDLDAVGWPAQRDGEIDEGVLTGSRFLVVEDLLRAGLSNINNRQTFEMMRLQLCGGANARGIRRRAIQRWARGSRVRPTHWIPPLVAEEGSVE